MPRSPLVALILDDLAWSPERDTLIAFRDACWYSWREQTRSMERLLAYGFEWVLPGHGRIHHASAEDMHQHLERCVQWMKKGRALIAVATHPGGHWSFPAILRPRARVAALVAKLALSRSPSRPRFLGSDT